MSDKTNDHFKFDSKIIPNESGCYLYFDDQDNLLYVGKAKNLKKRVSQYFQKNDKSPKVALMVSKIARIETRVVNAEIEALILENNLIKEYKPKFNILMRDDKNFTYLRVTNEVEPKLEIVRRVLKDGSTYFGPKTSAKEFRDTVKFCQKFFGAKMVKANQDYYINQLTGKEIPLEEYQANIERMKKFLRGNTKEVVAEITEKMMAFAADKNFEAAARMRDTLQSIDKSTQKQTVEFTDMIDRDFINFHRDGRHIYVVQMAFRQGKFRDLNKMIFNGAEFNCDEDIISSFLTQFYEKVVDPPREIFVPILPESSDTISEFLTQTYFPDHRIDVLIPQKGNKKIILDLAAKNAKNDAEKAKIDELSQAENFAKALPELAKALDLKDSPQRIECYDISHLSGTHTVASMVVFENGKPKNSEYRRFKIKQLEPGKIDDFASMKEVLERRFKRAETKTNKPESIDIHRADKKELGWAKEIYKKEGWDDVHSNEHLFVATKDKLILGMGRAEFFRKGKLATIGGIYVSPDHRGEKIGLKIVEKIIEHFPDIKTWKLAGHPWIKDYYEIIGFEVTEKETKELKRDFPNQVFMDFKTKKEKWVLPDLVVIDGGKGQLSSAMKCFDTLEVEGFDPQKQFISLAKREEQIFRPGISEPLELDFESPALKLLQRLRDEAHRFAISFNRSLRQKSLTKSALDDVTGIGSATKKKLMQHFETVSNIRNAEDEELLKIVNQKQLNNIRRQL